MARQSHGKALRAADLSLPWVTILDGEYTSDSVPLLLFLLPIIGMAWS
jgi:hypothetical protein